MQGGGRLFASRYEHIKRGCRTCATARSCGSPFLYHAALWEGMIHAMEHQQADTRIPFVLDRQAAYNAVRMLCGGWRTPAAARAALRPEAFRAVYVPFWRFHVTAACAYAGVWGEEQDYRDSDGDWQTDTDWHHIDGKTDCDLDDAVLMCAAAAYMDALEGLFPYDLSQAGSDAGTCADDIAIAPCTTDWEASWAGAQEHIRTLLRRMIEDDLCGAYQTQLARVDAMDISYTDIVPELILLPIWEASFVHNGTTYTVRVNAQTGRACGDLPSAPWRMGCLAPAVLILLFLLFLRW